MLMSWTSIIVTLLHVPTCAFTVFPWTWVCLVETFFHIKLLQGNWKRTLFSIRVLLVVIEASKWGGAGGCPALVTPGRTDAVINKGASSPNFNFSIHLKFIFVSGVKQKSNLMLILLMLIFPNDLKCCLFHTLNLYVYVYAHTCVWAFYS